jgi:arylsulfatase A-like enzyme/cytochrome c-type biogenesis protein CcmH/NrfG
LLCAVGCRPAARTPPNILLITLDTTRADHLGAYGDREARTPNLDRLATEGVVFEHAVAVAPITLPAHASLFTGVYPFVHGVRNNGNFTLNDSLPTLATVLRASGYRTAAFVSAFVLERRYGLARGFDEYDDRVQLERRADRTIAAATDWLNAHAGDGKPFLIWVHLYDPHDPYDPPPPFRDAFAGHPYDGEIAFADAALGAILDRLTTLGLRSSTIVLAAGDHGESLGEHHEATHSMFVYASVLRMPLIVAWPDHLPAGRRVPALVRAVDVTPTLLDLSGQAALPNAHGQSLAPLARGSGVGPPSAYGETYFPLFYMNWAPLRSIEDGRWKFIDAPSPELYDLSVDPRETMNLAARETSRAAVLRRALEALAGGGPGVLTERPIERETAQKLAALGYIGSATAGHVAAQENRRKDPKAMIGVFNQIRRANAAVEARRPAEAERLAREALTQDRDNAFATIVLANAQMEQGRYLEAVAAFRRYAELVPTSADAHHRIAVCFSRLGDVDRALAEEEAALAIDPRDSEAHELRGGLLVGRGRIDEAIRALRTAVEIEPANAMFRIGLARALLTAGQVDEAETEVRRGLELEPDSANAHAANAAVSAARNRFDAAAGEYARALQLRPDYDDVRLDFARTLERLGRVADAAAEYRRLASNPATPPDIRRAARQRLR